jgi:hypothetical protein
MDGDVKRKFLVRLVREVMAWQHQEVEVEVEAADEEEAERKAVHLVEDNYLDPEDWEVMDDGGPYQILVPPFADAIEALPQS